VTETPFLPYCRHVVDDDDVAAVAAVLKGDWLTTGPAVAAFEQALAEAVGAPYAAACANGTAALHLTALALDLKPGDWVIVPAQTFAATANAARFTGADVVFSDVCPESGLMRPEDLAATIATHRDKRLKAVYPVHLNGQPADMAALSAIARRAGLAVVEDAAHAIGSVDADGGRIGDCRHSDMVMFSFHAAKTVTMGEGGAVTSRDAALHQRVLDLRSHGIVRDAARFTQAAEAFDSDGAVNPWYYELPAVGFNYRATDFSCALGQSQLAKLAHFAETRRRLAAAYDRALADLAPLVRLLGRRPGVAPVWHLYVALIDFAAAGRTRGQVMRRLRALGVGTQVNYIPVHWLPYYRHYAGPLSLPGAEAYYRRCLSLPLSAAMTEGDVGRVVRALRQALGAG
jgi:UDP-4-amino-4,6-dideoxy-N-acetyl-beta-L-altrosamine transaminase